ncbi:hypothetical protein LOZ12_000229 [Ophidiomyces ophidiicola]|uniref:Uncharacterized protein n=1 Tax=Ophidiomyces ophidiicola TaxID=1387563 RepID=A0ACB8V4U8_9EURO|nr:hypothetical protein LOZ62_001438 [Ophidiomyces ophidiicola]KAI1970147.1 hypothetical protein LOZ56_003886 [Ophidiomyces ophidiicola]KAI2004578.1 hypothetical protein LOZ50_004183 [Ophidiomyces ophidiicola]KAI2023832.1 hypothetical protein LOZ45_003832 [Ophidiomyces ophidiicola]KAI2038620.1 hypothetical protein LOZ47_002999 [Ophidiomyces ophidiicola]
MAQGGARSLAPFFKQVSPVLKITRSRRPFSSTRSYTKEPVPTFTPTSSPELTRLFEKYRQNFFIPMSLGLRHRNLIYKNKYAKKLEDNPISINIGRGREEIYHLKPLEKTGHPGTSELREVVALMKTREDWYNLLPLLVGLKISKRQLVGRRLTWLIRRAGFAGQASILLECAKQSKRTGLTLNHADIAMQFFLAIRYNAREAGFRGPEVQTSLRQATQAAELLDAPEHTSTSMTKDAKRFPEIIGILLELEAANTLNTLEGKDVEGRVRSYAEKLISTWRLGNLDIPSKWHEANLRLLNIIPTWHGISLALQVKDIQANTDLSNSLRSYMSELGGKIEAAVEIVAKENPTAAGLKQAELLYRK